MVDRRGEDLPRIVKAAAGIEHALDVGAIFGPLLDLVEVAVVRDQRIVRLFVELVYRGRIVLGGRRRMSSFSTPLQRKSFLGLKCLKWPRQVR